MKHLLLVMALISAPLPVLAHKVIAGIFPTGDSIEGEIGFSNGDVAANTEVIVSDPEGAELGRVTTDAEGFFTFIPTVPVAHVFRANLGAGHLAEAVLPANEVAMILGTGVSEAGKITEAEAPAAPPGESADAAFTADQRRLIAKTIRDEVRPLRRELAAYKEHNDFQTILGGIGYIAGLFGLGFYLAARRRPVA